MTPGLQQLVRYYKTPEMCRTLSFGQDRSGACLLLMAPESSILWALISVTSPYAEWHSWVHVDANHSNCALATGRSIMSLSFLILNPLDGKILELSRFISDETSTEDGETYLFAYRLIQKFVFLDLKKMNLARLLPPEPVDEKAISLQPAGLIGDSHGSIHTFMTTVIPERDNEQLKDVGSRIRDCGQHFRHGLNNLKRDVTSYNLSEELEAEILAGIVSWSSDPDITSHHRIYESLHQLCAKHCPSIVGSLEWYEAIYAKWHPALRPASAPLTSLCEARYGFLNRIFGKGTIYKNVLTFAAQFINFRLWMTKLHSNLLSTKDLNKLAINSHRENVRQTLRSQSKQASNSSATELVQIGPLQMPRTLAEDFISSDALLKLYRTDSSAFNRTHRSDQKYNQNWSEHSDDIFCRCPLCVKLLVPVNSTSLEKRKRRIGAPHSITKSSTESAVQFDFRFSSIKLQTDPVISFSFEIHVAGKPDRSTVVISEDLQGEGPRSLRERGISCSCAFWQHACLARSCQKGSFQIDRHVVFVLRVFFGYDIDSLVYRAGSFTPFDLRMALRKHPPGSRIYADPSSLSWNSLSELHSVYDIKTNRSWNASSSLMSGVFISAERLSAIVAKTLCHGCRISLSSGDLVFNIPGITHFNVRGKQLSSSVKLVAHLNGTCLKASLTNTGSFKIPDEKIRKFNTESDFIFILDSIWNSLPPRDKSVLLGCGLQIAVRATQPSLVFPKVKSINRGKRGRPSHKVRSEHHSIPDDRYSQKLPVLAKKTRAKLPRFIGKKSQIDLTSDNDNDNDNDSGNDSDNIHPESENDCYVEDMGSSNDFEAENSHNEIHTHISDPFSQEQNDDWHLL